MEVNHENRHTKKIQTPLVDQLDLNPENTMKAQALFGKLTQEINKKLNEGIDYEKVLDFIFESLNLLIPCDRLGIAIVNESTETIRLNWVRSKLPIQHLGRNYTAPLKGSSLLRILETEEPRIINDLMAYAIDHPDSESTKLILLDGVRSNLTCPLKSNGKLIGIVFFSSSKFNAYEHKHIEIFQSIANELAVIVEHGRLKHCFSDSVSKDRTLRMVLHDLKAPLSIIQGHLELSANETWYQSLNPHVQKIFETLRRNTRNMFQLLGDLSEFIQVRRELNSLNVSAVNPNEFSKEMAESGEFLARQKEISFAADIGKLPPVSHFDHDKVRRVIENLFTNAIKFSKRGSSITFRVLSDLSHLTFAVSDQGQGIPNHEQAKLFKEFGKTSIRPTENESSTGLGLAIAKNIVEQHGGKISVVSKPGEGSTFSFWLPLR